MDVAFPHFHFPATPQSENSVHDFRIASTFFHIDESRENTETFVKDQCLHTTDHGTMSIDFTPDACPKHDARFIPNVRGASFELLTA